MAIEIAAAPLPDQVWPPSPLNADGDPYQYCMVFNAATAVAWADSATELVGLLIDGYLDVPEADLEEQAIQRVLYSVGAQVRAQARILDEADLSVVSPEELATLEGDRDKPPAVEVWTCPVPLVLVDAFYAPYGDRARPRSEPRDGSEPGSNIIWLPHVDEVAFLTGLARIGEVTLASPDYAEAAGA